MSTKPAANGQGHAEMAASIKTDCVHRHPHTKLVVNLPRPPRRAHAVELALGGGHVEKRPGLEAHVRIILYQFLCSPSPVCSTSLFHKPTRGRSLASAGPRLDWRRRGRRSPEGDSDRCQESYAIFQPCASRCIPPFDVANVRIPAVGGGLHCGRTLTCSLGRQPSPTSPGADGPRRGAPLTKNARRVHSRRSVKPDPRSEPAGCRAAEPPPEGLPTRGRNSPPSAEDANRMVRMVHKPDRNRPHVRGLDVSHVADRGSTGMALPRQAKTRLARRTVGPRRPACEHGQVPLHRPPSGAAVASPPSRFATLAEGRTGERGDGRHVASRRRTQGSAAASPRSNRRRLTS